MSNYEQSAKAIDSDYRYAPVGMAVGSFWGGALVAGLTAFAMSVLIAKGMLLPTTIVNGERVLFVKDYKGLYDGIAVAAILFVMSLFLGLATKASVDKKKDIAALWKLMIFVPVITVIVTIAAIVLNH